MPQSGRRIFYWAAKWRAGDHRGAAEAFAAAVRLMPDVVEARLNLASALMTPAGMGTRCVNLKRCWRDNPNEIALQNVARLRALAGESSSEKR